MALTRQCLVLRQQPNFYLDINNSQLKRPLQYPNQLLKPRHVIGITFIRYVKLGILSTWQLTFMRALEALQLYIIFR